MSLDKPPAIRHGGLTQQTSRGRLALWAFDPGLLVFQIVDHGDRSFVAPIVAAFERRLRSGAPVEMFVDVELMTSYDTELRTDVTRALAPERKRIGCLHILVRSKLVSMGVSVANLALGGIMSIHTSPAAFQHALQSGLDRAKVTGFSPSLFARDRQPKPG